MLDFIPIFYLYNKILLDNDKLPTSSSSSPTSTIKVDSKSPNEAHSAHHRRQLDLISSCLLKPSERFQSEDLVKAGELQYIDQTLDEISEKLVIDLKHEHCTFSEFVQKCSIPIMYLLKRSQNLDAFMNLLIYKYERIRQRTHFQSSTKTNLSLRMLLHILLMNSDMFVQGTIISLATKRNPIPFVSPNIHREKQSETYEFTPAVIHVWKSKKPTILSFGVGRCEGKSTLLNQLFQSTFEQTIESIYFQQTIDIDFGYSFNPERSLNIADTHGLIDKRLLKEIKSLFDGFLIQIDQNYFDQHLKDIIEYIDVLSKDKLRIVVVRDVKHQNSEEYLLKIKHSVKQYDLELSSNFHLYLLPNICNTNDRNIIFAIQDLREEILSKIRKQISIHKDRKEEISRQLEKLMDKDYVEYLRKINKIIRPLKKYLLRELKDHNEENFPLYLKFQELCKLRQKLNKLNFYGSESENIFEMNKKLYALENELNQNNVSSSPNRCGQVFNLFIEVLQSDNQLMSLSLLASELKEELLSLGGDKLASDLPVQHAFLSLEVLWRNSIVCYEHTTIEKQNLIERSYRDFAAAGFPFEIIDGDNFHFQHQFLSKILNRFANERILVISIIGPQNSGKSTLLNYMFGTSFDVREGRCTRGIYGSLVKLDKSNQTMKKLRRTTSHDDISNATSILLIDTEGLLSVERGDPEYDRRLVLFSLAISHLVIVNMMGDINETLKDMLTLCADSLTQIGVNTTNRPTVHFILNQKADPNIKNHMEAVDKIVRDLNANELGQVIGISPETFHTLPSAFKKEKILNDPKSPCLLRTEPDFIEHTQQLCAKIIQSAIPSYERSDDVYSNPLEWLRISVDVFNTLQKFPDLTYFKDVTERRQDDQIREEIQVFISKQLTPEYRDKLIKENCDLTENAIRRNFQAQFDVLQNESDDNLENIFKITNASNRIRERLRQFLKRQITEICNAWCIATIQDHDKKQMISLVRDGAAELRSLIDQIITDGRTMTKDDANKEFEKMWKEKIEVLKRRFQPEERLKQVIKFVYGNYNVFEKKNLPNHENILHYQEFVRKLSERPNVDDVTSSIQTKFEKSVSNVQLPFEMCRNEQSTDDSYTLSTLENFKYLNRRVLIQVYCSGVSEQPNDPSRTTTSSASHEYFRRRPAPRYHQSNAFERVFKWLRSGATRIFNQVMQPSPSSKSSSLPFEFIDATSQVIFEERVASSIGTPNILCISAIFKAILQETISIVCGHDANGTCRPIEIDLIQKVICLINTRINEINLELMTFKLSLSKPLKASIHTFILLLLAKFYYDEQKNHFNQQISTLEQEKPSLLTYFISMVVPDAECDKEGAKHFADQVKNAIQSKVKSEVQTIIRRNQNKQDLSRKHIQTICDGKLLSVASNDDWLFRYIVEPTKIIEEEFQTLWEPIEKNINQEIAVAKNQWKNILIECFRRIEFMISSLKNEGPTVQYIGDIFEASEGVAQQNLKNKNQCMAQLLSAYLSGEQIKEGTSYSVRGQRYTLNSKGLKLFERLRPPNPQLAQLIKEMKDSENSNVNRLALVSIKNLSVFLQSIIDVRDKVEADFDGTSTTFRELDNSQTYNKLLDKALGCIAKCPCCDRPCDVDHTLIKSNAGTTMFTNLVFLEYKIKFLSLCWYMRYSFYEKRELNRN